MKRLNLALLVFLLLFSCQNSNEVKTIPVDNKYSLTIPSFLTPSRNLNEDASFQYQNLKREFYVIVIDDLISELDTAIDENELTDYYTKDVDGYTNLSLNRFEQEVSVLENSDILSTTINDLPANLITIKGHTANLDIFYSLAFIQGVNRYYQIMAWTLSSKESDHKEKMIEMINSFKEL